MLSRRDWLVGTGLIALGSVWSGKASASTLKGLSLAELSRASDRIIVGRSVAYESDWAYVAGSRRIVTVSRIIQETDFLQAKTANDKVEDEVLVLTLGGRVGDLGQKVPGEAQVTVGQDNVFFVSEEQEGVRRILGMSQGAYPIFEKDGARKLKVGRGLPHLVGARPGAQAPVLQRLAVDVLDGRTLKEAHSLVRSAR